MTASSKRTPHRTTVSTPSPRERFIRRARGRITPLAVAATAIGRLAPRDPDAAISILTALLEDPERTAVLAAGDAVAAAIERRSDMPAESARHRIARLAAQRRIDRIREAAGGWNQRIVAAPTESSTTGDG